MKAASERQPDMLGVTCLDLQYTAVWPPAPASTLQHARLLQRRRDCLMAASFHIRMRETNHALVRNPIEDHGLHAG